MEQQHGAPDGPGPALAMDSDIVPDLTAPPDPMQQMDHDALAAMMPAQPFMTDMNGMPMSDPSLMMPILLAQANGNVPLMQPNGISAGQFISYLHPEISRVLSHMSLR